MNFQEIIVGLLLFAAIAYLLRYFFLQTKAHDCSDCSLMEMKKQSEKRLQKSKKA